MHKNNTKHFISLVDEVLNSESNYFKALENAKKTKGYPCIQKTILDDYNVPYHVNTHNDNKKLFSEHIKEFVISHEDFFTMDTKILFDIAKQIHIDHLLNIEKSEKAHIYYSLAETLRHYGIFRNDKIVSLTNKTFWLELIKKLYLLNLTNSNGFYSNLDDDFRLDKSVQNLVNSIKYFKDNKNIKLDCIDSKIIFHKKQEDKILSIIENKLKQIDIFEFINFILIQNRNNRAIPFNYIVNIALKNIQYSNFKKNNKKTFTNILNDFIHFLNLYQLQQTSMYESIFIDEKNIEDRLKKQILYSNLYTINYPLKAITVINHINNLLGTTIINKSFEEKFNYTKKELINFLLQTEKYENKIIEIDLKLFEHLEHIMKFFSIDSKNINTDYLTPLNNAESKNLFLHNPIVKHKNKYYIVGFKYFKMYFYGALVEKIRLQIDKNINTKIGNNIDDYVEHLFNKNDFDIYTGEYKLSKKEKYECDLVVKLEDKIIFIENKNKALTKNSFSGSSIHILQDFIRAFATSQFQLFRHEKNLIDYKQLVFTNGKTLDYDNERIIKISLSPNNWYSLMNNVPKSILLALMQLRFTFKPHATTKDIEEFEKTNKDLEKLTDIIMQLDKGYNLESILFNSLFIPLELISENDTDKNFIHYVLGLLSMKYDTHNIYDGYNQSKKIKNFQKT